MTTDDRRTLCDRRRRPTPAIGRYTFLRGRRSAYRRTDERRRQIYVDRLGAGIWLALLSIFLFQLLDAHLTLTHLKRGGMELNPLMSFLIDRSEGLFLAVKLSVAGTGLLFLGIHKNIPIVKPGLGILFALFLAVVGWHCFLVFQPS